MLSAEASSAICVQRLDDSRNSAIHITYRISLRSSSLREPRYPLLRVVYCFSFRSRLGISPKSAAASGRVFQGRIEAHPDEGARLPFAPLAPPQKREGGKELEEGRAPPPTPSPIGASLMSRLKRKGAPLSDWPPQSIRKQASPSKGIGHNLVTGFVRSIQ